MDTARHSSLGVSIPSSPTCHYTMLITTRCAELTSGFLIVCFPEMSFLINSKARKRNYPQRPSSSYPSAANDLATARSQSRKMPSAYGQDLSYYELNDDISYGVRVSPTGSASRLTESANGTVQVHHEITIESTKKDEYLP